jgi:hypothetical protein
MRFYFFYKILIFIVVNKAVTSWRQHLHTKSRFILNSSKDKTKEKQCIFDKKKNSIYCDSAIQLFIDKDDFLSNKKLITISPGGFKGFYLLGILTYIKENYNVDNLIYSGASAGAWNSLFMSYKGPSLAFVYSFIDENIRRAKTITELQYFIINIQR